MALLGHRRIESRIFQSPSVVEPTAVGVEADSPIGALLHPEKCPVIAEFDQLLFRGREQDGTYALRPPVRMHVDRVELTGSRVRVAGSRAEDGEPGTSSALWTTR